MTVREVCNAIDGKVGISVSLRESCSTIRDEGSFICDPVALDLWADFVVETITYLTNCIDLGIKVVPVRKGEAR